MRETMGGLRGIALLFAVAGAGCGDDGTAVATPSTDAAADGADETKRPDVTANDSSDAALGDAGSDAPDTDDAGHDAGHDGGADGACSPSAAPPHYPPLSELSPVCDGVNPATLVGSQPPAGALPVYPALRGDSLPLFGTPRFSFEIPQQLLLSRTVEVRDAAALSAACEFGQTTVRVLERVSFVDILAAYDCDIVLEPGVTMGGLSLRQARRVRVRGGTVAGFSFEDSSDITIDGVVVNSGILPAAERRPGLFLGRGVERLAIVNVVGRAAQNQSGSAVAFNAWRWQNVLVAHSNFTTDPDATGDGWFAGLDSGANWLFVDVQAKVFQGPLLRLDTEEFGQNRPLSYVLVRGGAYMQDGAHQTFVNASPGGESCIDQIHLEGVSFFLGDAANAGGALAFGETRPDQLTFRWFGTDLHWFTRSCAAVNARVIAGKEALAGPNEALRYRLGNPTFTDRAADFRYPEWQPIAGFADSNPERLPEL